MNLYTVADNNKITEFNSWIHGYIGIVVESEKWIEHKTFLIPDTKNNVINDEFSFLMIPDEENNGKRFHQMVVTKTRGVDERSKNYAIQKTIRFLSLISYIHESPIEIVEKKIFNRHSTIKSKERFSTKGISYIDFQSSKIPFIEKWGSVKTRYIFM